MLQPQCVAELVRHDPYRRSQLEDDRYRRYIEAVGGGGDVLPLPADGHLTVPSGFRIALLLEFVQNDTETFGALLARESWIVELT